MTTFFPLHFIAHWVLGTYTSHTCILYMEYGNIVYLLFVIRMHLSYFDISSLFRIFFCPFPLVWVKFESIVCRMPEKHKHVYLTSCSRFCHRSLLLLPFTSTNLQSVALSSMIFFSSCPPAVYPKLFSQIVFRFGFLLFEFFRQFHVCARITSIHKYTRQLNILHSIFVCGFHFLFQAFSCGLVTNVHNKLFLSSFHFLFTILRFTLVFYCNSLVMRIQ